MQQPKVAIRYAKALLQLAKEQNALDNVYADMTLIKSVCEENKELLLLLKSPIIKTDKKQVILNDIFTGKITPLSHAFIRIIVSKKREELLHSIADGLIMLYKIHNNIETATVITATELSEELREEVLLFIKKHGQKNVDLTEKVNNDIIGGVIIRMGDKQLDTSVRKAIKELKQSFNKNLYIQDF